MKSLENKRLQSLLASTKMTSWILRRHLYFLVFRIFTAIFPSSPEGSLISFPNCRFHLDRGNTLIMINRELFYTTQWFWKVLNFGDISIDVPSGVNRVNSFLNVNLYLWNPNWIIQQTAIQQISQNKISCFNYKLWLLSTGSWPT